MPLALGSLLLRRLVGFLVGQMFFFIPCMSGRVRVLFVFAERWELLVGKLRLRCRRKPFFSIFVLGRVKVSASRSGLL